MTSERPLVLVSNRGPATFERGEAGDLDARPHRLAEPGNAERVRPVVEGEPLPGVVEAAERVVEGEGDHDRDRQHQVREREQRVRGQGVAADERHTPIRSVPSTRV
jgi:hypothetical protein